MALAHQRLLNAEFSDRLNLDDLKDIARNIDYCIERAAVRSNELLYKIAAPLSNVKQTDGDLNVTSDHYIVKFLKNKDLLDHLKAINVYTYKTKFFDLSNSNSKTDLKYEKNWGMQLFYEFFLLAKSDKPKEDITKYLDRLILISYYHYCIFDEVDLDLKAVVSDYLDDFCKKKSHDPNNTLKLNNLKIVEKATDLILRIIKNTHDIYFSIDEDKNNLKKDDFQIIEKIESKKIKLTTKEQLICWFFKIGSWYKNIQKTLMSTKNSSPVDSFIQNSYYSTKSGDMNDLLGHIYFNTGDYNKALSYFEKAHSLGCICSTNDLKICLKNGYSTK